MEIGSHITRVCSLTNGTLLTSVPIVVSLALKQIRSSDTMEPNITLESKNVHRPLFLVLPHNHGSDSFLLALLLVRRLKMGITCVGIPGQIGRVKMGVAVTPSRPSSMLASSSSSLNMLSVLCSVGEVLVVMRVVSMTSKKGKVGSPATTTSRALMMMMLMVYVRWRLRFCFDSCDFTEKAVSKAHKDDINIQSLHMHTMCTSSAGRIYKLGRKLQGCDCDISKEYKLRNKLKQNLFTAIHTSMELSEACFWGIVKCSNIRHSTEK